MSEPTKNKGGRPTKQWVQLKLTPSPEIATTMRSRAAELGMSVTAYVEQLVRADVVGRSTRHLKPK